MKKKRILSAVLAVAMVVSLCCTPAFAAVTPNTSEYIITENGVTKVYDPITGDLWYDSVNGRTDAFQEYWNYIMVTKKGQVKGADKDEFMKREPAWSAIVKMENNMPVITNPSNGFGTFGSSNDDFYNPDGIDFVNPDVGKLYYNDYDVKCRKESDALIIKEGARLEPYMKGIIGARRDNTIVRACLGSSKRISASLNENVTFELKDSVLTIKGDGKTAGLCSVLQMVSYYEPWAANKYVKTIIIDGRILDTNWSFSNLTNLETVIIMNNSTEIGDNLTPFQDCPNLKTIIWGANMKDEKGLKCHFYSSYDPQGRSDKDGHPLSQHDDDFTAELDNRISQMAGKTFINLRSSKFIPVKVPNTVVLTSYYGDWDARVAKAKQYIAEANLPAEVLAMLPAELGGTKGAANTKPVETPKPPVVDNQPVTETTLDKTISDWARSQVADAEGWNLIPFQALGTNYKTAITRGQFCALATRLCEELNDGEALPYDTDVFTDVDNSNTDILKMYKAGIIGGYGNGKFGPNDPLTREQAAAIIGKMCSAMGTDLEATKTNSFTDKFSPWAVDAVNKVYSNGIMSGYNNTTFGAWDKYTIEQSIISMLRTYLHILDDRGEIGA